MTVLIDIGLIVRVITELDLAFKRQKLMRILIVHNKYQCHGGEDAVVESEGALLVKYGHVVEYQFFNNNTIRTRGDQLLSGIGIIYNRTSAKVLQKKILAFNPDVIHVHNIHFLASPSVFYVARRLEVPVVMTLHNFRLICPSATLFYDHRIYEKSVKSLFAFSAVMRGVYRKSRIYTAAIALSNFFHNLTGTWEKKIDRYIVMSEFAAQKFRTSALRVSPQKFFVKPNFVSDHGIGGKDRDHTFLFVGRLSEEKGIEMLLSAAAVYSFHLIVIGDGPLRPLVLHFEKHYPNIEFKGFLSKGEVIEHLKKCTALIFPSICYEGFPISVLEAFSTATPVIASRLGVLCNIIQDESNGLLFEPGNPHELYTHISRLSTDVPFQILLGTNARESFVRHYTEQANYRSLIQLYEEVVGRPSFNQDKALAGARFPKSCRPPAAATP